MLVLYGEDLLAAKLMCIQQRTFGFRESRGITRPAERNVSFSRGTETPGVSLY